MKRTISLICAVVLTVSMLLGGTGCKKQEEEQEVRACWVASVGNLDFPSQTGLSKADLQKELDAIVENCKSIGLNAIFFQVRPMGDALYRSEIFPWSAYLSGTQGLAPEEDFDPLKYIIQKAHTANIQLHAWINPYRVCADTTAMEMLSAENPAVTHPEYTFSVDGGLYYNPGLPEVRGLILDGVEEIAENYDVDGIHFDDYFYPYTDEIIEDGETYSRYGNGLTLEDFRRDAVNQLVREAGERLHKHRDDASFGISPFGIWANRSVHYDGSDTNGMSSYSAIYSDSKKWVEEGWLDYVCPQIYWSSQHPAAPYDELVDWWSALCEKNNTDLYVGIALYKVGTDEAGWEDGSIMKDQLQYASHKSAYAGHSFFRYGLMIQNPLGALDSIREYYAMDQDERVVADQEDPFHILNTAAAGASAEGRTENVLTIQSPANNVTVSSAAVSVAGSAPAGQVVLVNGVEAVTNSFGLYAAYIPLKVGDNRITVTAGDSRQRITVKRAAASSAVKLSSCYPSGKAVYSSGDTVEFSVTAPAGATVTLKNDWLQMPLYPKTEKGTRYYGMWTIPAIMSDEPLEMNGFTYIAQTSEGEQILNADFQLTIYPDGYREEAILQKDGYQFDPSRDGTQMDHDPLRKGGAVTVCAMEGTRALLNSGYWVEQELLSKTQTASDEPLDYEYEVVTVRMDKGSSYYTAFEEGGLSLRFSQSLNEELKVQTKEKDLRLDFMRGISESSLQISSKSNRVLAGYDVRSHENGITVYLRFHSKGLSGKTILLDAGHGGEDSGALSAGGIDYPTESELNLLLSQYIREELESEGAKVTLLRANDTTIELDERVEIGESVAPDLYLSVHHNSVDFTSNYNKATGGLVLYSSPLSKDLAEHLSYSFWSGVAENGEALCRRQSLRVCRQTRYPAVLIEAGYVCNPLEYELLCKEDIARKIAENTVEGLKSYFVTVCS